MHSVRKNGPMQCLTEASKSLFVPVVDLLALVTMDSRGCLRVYGKSTHCPFYSVALTVVRVLINCCSERCAQNIICSTQFDSDKTEILGRLLSFLRFLNFLKRFKYIYIYSIAASPLYRNVLFYYEVYHWKSFIILKMYHCNSLQRLAICYVADFLNFIIFA